MQTIANKKDMPNKHIVVHEVELTNIMDKFVSYRGDEHMNGDTRVTFVGSVFFNSNGHPSSFLSPSAGA